MGKSQARSSIDFWAILSMFWGNEAANELRDLIFGPAIHHDGEDSTAKTFVNRLYNVITLTPKAHKFWSEGLFVLEPHPDDDPNDQRNLRAIFYWVYPHESSHLGPGIYPLINLTSPLPSVSPTLSQSPGSGYIGLTNGRTNPLSPIGDGHIVSFTTDDPTKSPLPSRELLYLQSTLIRVLRMAGRAGWDVREMNESDRDVDSVVNEGESEGLESSATGPTTLWTNSTLPESRPMDGAQNQNKSRLRYIISRIRTLFHSGDTAAKVVNTTVPHLQHKQQGGKKT